jgi:glutathione S-transferase
MHLHATLITLLNVIILALAVTLVGQARGRYQIKAPAIIGNPDFERVFRAHQNTIEQTVMFLPLLWLVTIYGNEQFAAWLGYAWLVGRLWYLFAYAKAADKRSPGFGIASLALIGLLLLAFWALVPQLLH